VTIIGDGIEIVAKIMEDAFPAIFVVNTFLQTI
jgi:hypothetical protein